MSKAPKNADAIGVILVFLLASRRTGKIPALGQAIDFSLFARDLHRMVDMVDQLDGLGQFASHRQAHSLPQPQSYSRDYDDHYDDDYDTGQEDFGQNNFSLPDMSQLMDMAGPLLSIFGGRR